MLNNGFIKTACIANHISLGNPDANGENIVKLIKTEIKKRKIGIAVFPELSLTGATCGHLFLQSALLKSSKENLIKIAKASEGIETLIFIGLPLEINGLVYNCSAAISDGKILGIVPKKKLTAEESRFFSVPNDKTFYIENEEDLIAVGNNLTFTLDNDSRLTVAVAFTDLSKSTSSGATVIVNHSSLPLTPENVVKAEREASAYSSLYKCAYISSNPNSGESSGDFFYSGLSFIAENGEILAKSTPFDSALTITDIDILKINSERKRDFKNTLDFGNIPTAEFHIEETNLKNLDRKIKGNPFIPETEKDLELILNIQAESLAHRLAFIHSEKAIIGISGGLDSTLAILVCARAMKILEKPSKNVIAITMPCFGTTKRTRSNAEILCNELGVDFREINIKNTVLSHFNDIGHNPKNYDITFENAQARVRTLELMDIANQEGGIVVGTGDLSELALGWATYNGDHMSMYSVNAGVPKTLVRALVKHEADNSNSETLKKVLLDIIDTPVSPELLPISDSGETNQKTENLVGPYELHDFYLYYVLKYGYTPKKILALAKVAFKEKEEYTDTVLIHWLKNFYKRFFIQQFKRSCMPDGPCVTGLSLSPRGAWSMPTDSYSSVWMKELETL